MKFKILAVLLTIYFVAFVSIASEPDGWERAEVFTPSEITELAVPSLVNIEEQKSEIAWRDTFGKIGTGNRGISVLIRDFFASDSNWELLIRNSEWEIVDRIDSSVLISDHNIVPGEFWTPSYESSEITIELRKQLGTKIRFKVSHIATKINSPVSQSVIDSSDSQIESYLSFKGDKLIDPVANKVGRVLIKNLSRNVEESCTGFLVTKNEVITNQHCMAELKVGEKCSGVSIDLFFDVEGANKRFQCKQVTAINYPLDLARFELTRDVEKFDKAMEIARCTREQDALFLVHHPGGKAKHITFSRCNLSGLPFHGRNVSRYSQEKYKDTQAIYHTCDSLGGSSGGPLVNHKGELVAVHSGGFRSTSPIRLNRATIASVANDLLN